MTPTASSKATRKPPAREKELLDRQAEAGLEARNAWPDNANFQMKLKGDVLTIRLRGPRAEELWRALLDATKAI